MSSIYLASDNKSAKAVIKTATAKDLLIPYLELLDNNSNNEHVSSFKKKITTYLYK